MQVLNHMGRKAMRYAASVMVLSLFGILAGCGGGGGGSGDAVIPPPDDTVTLQSIEITPSIPTAAAGTKAQFNATGVFTDNSTQDLTAEVTWESSDDAVATVSNTGLATTTAAGSTTVTATSGDVSGDTMLTVTDATLVSLEVTPAAPSLANGLTQQFTATGVFTDNSAQDLTTQVTWESSDESVATVSNTDGSNGLATTAAAGSTTVSATSGGVSGSTSLTVTNATLVSIEVSPAAPSLVNGLTQQLTATGVFTDNSIQDLTTQVTWASSDGAVATVSNDSGSNGLATAISAGGATVSATSGGVSGSTTLTVTNATLVSIEVSPAAPSLANGLTQQFTATGLFTDNSTHDLTTQVTWASSEETVATVSNADGSNGLATTESVGNTTVSATSGSVSGSTSLEVTAATLVSIEVTPAASSIANGLTEQFTATGVFTDNSTEDLTALVTWASSEETVATVSNAEGSNGLATTASAGSTTVSATSGSVSGSTSLEVTAATLVSIEVSPISPSLANGLTQQFTATGHFTDNSTEDLTALVIWASSEETVATVSNADGSNGLATAAGLGTTTVSATSGDVSDSTSLEVTAATLVSIEVTPAASSLAYGLTQQFTAMGHFTDASTQDLTTEVTWTSSEETVATVSNAEGSNGLATTASVGSTTVSATSGDVSGSTSFEVTAATLVSIDVSPDSPSLANGLTQQFTATGLFTDNSTEDLTTLVTWASSEETVATVSNADGSQGLATAAGIGTTTVSAMSGDVTGGTTLTVTAPNLVSIQVTPASPSVENGETQQFTATGHYTDNSTEDLTTQVTWASSEETVATVSNDPGSHGLATTTGVGSTTVSATSGGLSADTTLTVTEPPPPPPSVDELVAALLAAVTGQQPSGLKGKMKAVQDYLAVPDIASACTVMGEFKQLVSDQSGGHLTDEQVAQFTADAEEIETAIPCP